MPYILPPLRKRSPSPFRRTLYTDTDMQDTRRIFYNFTTLPSFIINLLSDPIRAFDPCAEYIRTFAEGEYVLLDKLNAV
jgi:hypothetical protein